MTHNRFAIVRDWEDTVSAEEECLRRLQLAARDLGIFCDIVDTSYRLISNRKVVVSSKSHDFVLHLHYCSGKAEDVFSFVPIWNPIDFFHKWGYRTSTDTFLTNDDFLRSTSLHAELHLKRLTAGSTYHLSDFLTLYPAPSQVHLSQNSFSSEKRRLMYCGINWERLDSKKGRFSSLLKKLDDNDLIDIYGPEVFHGIRPWAGYKNYKGSIPFDGISMLEAISRSGVGLVISSDSHFKDEVVSNRLFETIAAGAVVISDNNPGVRRLLGDSCLYIDTEDLDVAYSQIRNHLSWIERNPGLVSKMLLKNQELFVSKLSAKSSLEQIYCNLELRKSTVHKFRQPIRPFKLSCFYLIDQFSSLAVEEQVSIILKSISANSNSQITNYFLCDSKFSKAELLKLEEYGNIIQDTFFYKEENIFGRKLPEIISDHTSQYFSIILPGEELFSDHFASIIKAMQLKGFSAGSSDFVLRKKMHEAIIFEGARWNQFCEKCWTGGNFVFDISMLQKNSCSLFLHSLSYGASNFIASCSESIATSGGYSCKVHQRHAKTLKEVESISDYREVVRPTLVQLAHEDKVQAKTSVIRRFYDNNYSVVVKLKRYPFIWESLKNIFKPFM